MREKKFETVEQIIAIAKKYKTKQEFRQANSTAMSTVHKMGWMRKVEKAVQWEKPLRHADIPRAEIEAHAKLCSTKSEFQYGHNFFYRAAKVQGILQEMYDTYIPELRKADWTYETAAEAAKLYTTRKAFQYGDHRGAYQWLRRNKLLDKACDAAGIKNVRRAHTKESAVQEAKKYKTLTDIIAADPGLRSTIDKNGWQEEAYAHLVRPDTCTASDYDAIYLWRSDIKFDGNWVYKVGLTSHRLGEDRIRKVATAAGTTAKILILCKTTCNAIHVERLIKKFGTRPTLKWFNGYKEFRVMTAAQVRQVMSIIKQHAAA